MTYRNATSGAVFAPVSKLRICFVSAARLPPPTPYRVHHRNTQTLAGSVRYHIGHLRVEPVVAQQHRRELARVDELLDVLRRIV
jgi:hypothetical protein